MKQAYLEYYTPLLQQFCKSMQGGNYQGLEHMPQPFLPLFGVNYERSAFKFLIIGQDTKAWGNTTEFMERELESPGKRINEMFWEIDNFDFKKDGKSTNSFMGFAMALLASVHGMPDWNVLKWGRYQNILSSFAWGNANAVITKATLDKYIKGVPLKTWETAHAAGEHLNRFSHMLETLKPRVVLITVKSLDKKQFFKGFNLITMASLDQHIEHYRLKGQNVDIFHTYHPGYMRNVGGPWSFLNKLKTTLQSIGLAPDFPDFISADDSGDDVVGHLMKSAPRPDGNNQRKYEFVTWVAGELTKHKAFMSVPRLVQMANELGYRTNYGTTFSGGRGSYRLVRGAYHRNDPENAKRVAESFLKPDFTYAY